MRHFSLFVLSLSLLMLAEVPAVAQYPGQYPPGGYPPGGYPPGQYPPDQYPGSSGTGIPFPRRGKKKTAEQDAGKDTNLKQTSGVLRKLDDKAITLTADDTRNILFKRADTTKFLKKGAEIQPSVLKPGDHLSIEASQDDQGYFHAVRVSLEKEGTAEERAKASVAVEVEAGDSSPGDDDDRPTLRRGDGEAKDKAANSRPAPSSTAPPNPAPAPSAAPAPAATPAPAPEPEDRAEVPVVESNVPIDETDPGAPRLRHGGKAKSRKAADEDPAQVASNLPSKAPGRAPAAAQPVAATTGRETVVQSAPLRDPRIEKARNAVAQFTESLPSYVCQEQIARFVSTTHRVDWRPVDLVSAELVYEDHKEQYRNLAINGKPIKKGMEQLTGSWSTGEFGTVLVDLFSPATAADFRYRRTEKIAGRDAYMFAFEVDQENSHWHVLVPSQSIQPAYRGNVWTDKETSQVLRVEMEAVQLPKEYPLDKIESATDYQYVRLAERQFLLPVHAEVLSCQRGTDDCSRNAIDFRNYHKYSGESSITFENK